MPVGNSDSGVGLWAGQIMFAVDNINQYVDWWHEALPGSGEGFDHEGTLTSTIVVPKITIGLSNYWNLTLSQTIGNRYMNWNGDAKTIHHRDEGTNSNFLNALGGYFGDTKIIARYLLFNDGMGAGKRFFIGGGLNIPSKATLTSDPYFLNEEEKTEHRHFSLSEGVYKWVLETQFFKKRDLNPVFVGGTISSEIPLKENKYGFKASFSHGLSFSGLTKEIRSIKGSLGIMSDFRYTSKAYWNGVVAPNSESAILSIGVGGLWKLGSGVFGVNIQKPYFIKGAFASLESEQEQKQRVSAMQASISYRKMFDYTVPWLDPFKKM